MAVSDIDICNLALSRLGAAPIVTLTEETQNGELCKRFYSVVYDRVLRTFAWKCAMERVALAAVTAPAFGWDYAFALPASPYCLRVIEMDDPSYEFDVEGRKLLTDRSTAKIRYISRAQTGNLDPHCVQAVYINLAIELTHSIVGKDTIKNTLYEELLEKIMPDATKANMIEQLVPDYNKIKSGWIDARA
jgi:hypothetical protein